MSGHGEGGDVRVACQESLDDGQVLAGLVGKATVVVACLVADVGDVAEGAKQDLQSPQFLGQELVATGMGDEVVQAGVYLASFLDEGGNAGGGPGLEPAQVVGNRVEIAEFDAATGVPGGLAFEEAANLANFADLTSGDGANDGAAVGDEIDDADAGEGDEGLADGGVADAEASSEGLGDEVLTGDEVALEDIGKERLHDGLPTKSVVALERRGGRHDSSSRRARREGG